MIDKRRLEIICKEASLLISNPPTKQLAVSSSYVNENLSEEERIKELEKLIRTFKLKAAIHQGFRHGTGDTKSLIKFPEELLCILWMHRWVVADKISLENFKCLLKTDITF